MNIYLHDFRYPLNLFLFQYNKAVDEDLGVFQQLIAVPEISTERVARQRPTIDTNSFTNFYQVWRTDTESYH